MAVPPRFDAERIRSRLKLRDLDILMAVAETGSMGKAAARLHLSQPGISKAIADLEFALGAKLLDRSRQGAEPTAYGRALMRRSVAAFDELRQGIEDIAFLSDPTVGELRIGASEVAGRAIVSRAIDRLSRQHRGMRFQIVIGDSAPLNRALAERRIELAIARIEEPLGKEFRAQPLIEDSMFVAAGPRSPWLKRRKVALRDLADEPWIQIATESFFGSQVAATFEANGAEAPALTVTTPSLMIRDELLRTGRYLTMVGRLSLGFDPIRPLPIRLISPPTVIGFTFVKSRSLSPLAERFVETVRSMVSHERKPV